MSSATSAVLLTLWLGIQPITTDLCLSALPTVQRELGASIGAPQLTLSALIIIVRDLFEPGEGARMMPRARTPDARAA